jgi:hypothetical protein
VIVIDRADELVGSLNAGSSASISIIVSNVASGTGGK